MPLADLIPELAISAEAAAEYSKGSAVRALEIDPGFAEYVFIERDARRAAELEELRRRFSTKVIQVVNSDAAQALSQWLSDTDWRKNRAVMFLDPFGMQVEWSLVQAIAATRAIDLWMLFPIFAVNRMLARSGRLPDSWREKLNRVFGTEDWEQKFYISQATLLDGITATEKVANIALIQEFLLDRLRSVFSAVADPLTLYNSRGSPLFLLCFAAGNPKGAPTALRIAQHLIGRK
jgi:three-Cys-motif partner protein